MKRPFIWIALSIVLIFLIVALNWVPTVTIGVAVNDRAALSASEGVMLSVVQSYVTWHNSRGAPYRFRLEIATYKDDPAQALKDLAKRGAVAVVGFPLSLEATVAAPVARGLELPVISPAASSSALSGSDDWFFRVVQDSRGEGAQLSQLFQSLGVKDVAVYRSPYNDSYVDQLVDDIKSSSVAKISGISEYPGGNNSLSGDAVLIVAEPSRSYWIVQDVMLHWPPVPLVLSRWCQGSDFKTLLEIPDSTFYFASNYDPSVVPDDPFTSFLMSQRILDLGLFARQGGAAMAYLADVLEEDPRAKGERLRQLLSKPREVSAPGWKLSMDRFGDASAELKFFLLRDGEVSEVRP